LAKYLFISNKADAPNLTCKNIPEFFTHLLERVDWNRDLHFQTKTTIDTLDYSGTGWNAGSKVIIAARGKAIRTLAAKLPDNMNLPTGFSKPVFFQKGILAIQSETHASIEALISELEKCDFQSIPLIVVCDDSAFVAANTNNFVWVTFTRSNPSHDVYGLHAKIEHKHWSCKDSVVIDARVKEHHAPPLIPDKSVQDKVDKLFKKSSSLYGH